MKAWNRRRRRGFGFGDSADPRGSDWANLSRVSPGLGVWRRAPRQGVLAGVCAGLARALHVQPLAVRLGFVAAGMVSGPFAVIVYVVLAAVMPVAETSPESATTFVPPAAAADAAEKPSVQLAAVRERLQACDRRIGDLERHVIAQSFDLDRAIRNLDK
jgi:phage shock protein C